MEIILRENKEITNSALSENLTTALNAFSKAEDNVKEVAHALGTIMLDELYTDDFATVKDFANYLSCSTAKLTQFARFEKIMRTNICNDMFGVMSMTQILECARIIEHFNIEIEETRETVEIIMRKNIKPTMTCKEIRNFVEGFLNPRDTEAEAEEAVDTEAGEVEAEEGVDTEAEEAVDTEAEEKTSLVNYLSELEEGFELDKEDMKVIKRVIKMLSK